MPVLRDGALHDYMLRGGGDINLCNPHIKMESRRVNEISNFLRLYMIVTKYTHFLASRERRRVATNQIVQQNHQEATLGRRTNAGSTTVLIYTVEMTLLYCKGLVTSYLTRKVLVCGF